MEKRNWQLPSERTVPGFRLLVAMMVPAWSLTVTGAPSLMSV